VETAEGVTLRGVRWIDHARYGRCLEVDYATPARPAREAAAISLRPQRRAVGQE